MRFLGRIVECRIERFERCELRKRFCKRVVCRCERRKRIRQRCIRQLRIQRKLTRRRA